MCAILQYDDLDSKHSKFQYLEQKEPITRESEFNDFFCTDNGQKKEFVKSSIFRGVGEAKWKIFSSCQRAFLSGKVYGDNQSLFIEREVSCLESSVLPDYYKKLGIQETVFLCLSFLQHYGAPTTLIDFSTNYEVALWMAVSNIQYTNNGGDNIDDYFSLYWIDKDGRKEVPNVLDVYKKQFISTISDTSKQIISKDSDIGDKLRNARKDKNELSEAVHKILRWDNGSKDSCLAKMRLGFISTGNSSGKYDKRYSADQIENELEKAAQTLSRTMTSSAIKAFKNIVFYLFNDVIKIANLNLVAQDGCFIHYMPEDYNTPLEEDPDLKVKIHCVDIHKSLAPFILKKLEWINVTRRTLFPDTYALAQDAFSNAQAAK